VSLFSGGNILVTKDHVVKIADFGLTRHMIDSKTMARMSASGMKLLTQRVVTAWWRPPEVHLGDNKYTEKADMWSIGAVFGEMLTGVCIAMHCTAGYLSFHPMAQCVVHALKGLACRASPSRAR
jgi:serine/threonine protein kinase